MKNEFYIDMISRSIIDSLSDEIAGKTNKEINSYIKEFLENEYSEVITNKIKTEVKQIEKAVAEIEKKTIKQVGESAKDIKEYIKNAVKKNMAVQTAEINDAIKEIKKELSETGDIRAIIEASGQELKEHISEIKKELSETGDIRAIIETSGQELKEHISEIKKELSETGNIKAIVEDSSQELKEHISEIKNELSGTGDIKAIIEGSAKEIKNYILETGKDLHSQDDNSSLINNELAGIKQTLEKTSRQQNSLLKELLQDHLITIIEKVWDSVEDLKEGQNKTAGFEKIIANSNKEFKKYIKDMGIGLKPDENNNAELKEELANLRQTLEENKKEESEMLKGVYYSVKQLLSDNSREEASTQFESALKDVKNQINENTEKQLRIETDSHEKIAGEFRDSINDVKNYIDGKIEKSFKENAQKDVASNELAEIRKTMGENEREQIKLLNGVFYSVKKIAAANSKEKEDSEDLTAQFRNMLDALKGHVRRLESEKDELSVELLRLAGDDFFKDKFAELEKEMKKTKNLADEYLREKTELEGKLKAFQHLWEKSAAEKG